MFNLLSKKIKIKGKNNEICSIKDNKKQSLFCCPNSSSIKISGNNNKIIFNYDNAKKIRHTIPKGLKIIVSGSNNLININLPIKFENVSITEKADNNIFDIKTQSIPVRNAKFVIVEDSSILIGSDCELKAGNLYVVASNNYKKHSMVKIGDGCYIAKDTIIRNSNGQTMLDAKTRQPLENQEPLDLIIEDDVWIGSRATILRGSYIAKGSIVGACSLVNKRFEEENSVIAGVPAKVIKKGVTWDKRHYGVFMRDCENNSTDTP